MQCQTHSESTTESDGRQLAQAGHKRDGQARTSVSPQRTQSAVTKIPLRAHVDRLVPSQPYSAVGVQAAVGNNVLRKLRMTIRGARRALQARDRSRQHRAAQPGWRPWRRVRIHVARVIVRS